jgi:hypothetical protein
MRYSGKAGERVLLHHSPLLPSVKQLQLKWLAKRRASLSVSTISHCFCSHRQICTSFCWVLWQCLEQHAIWLKHAQSFSHHHAALVIECFLHACLFQFYGR